jgi:two-component system chemotaxis response regulator CheB
MSKIELLIVDDSPLFIDVFTRIVELDDDIEVVGSAGDGAEALRQLERLRPNIVVMDINMPVMNGIEAVERMMAARPTPILLQTADPRRRDEVTSFEALSRGALDIVAKPRLTCDGEAEQVELRARVRLLSRIPVVSQRQRHRRPSQAAGLRHVPVGLGGVAIVASTGGPPALADILAALPPDFSLPLVVVQHLSPGFAPNLVSWLDGVSPFATRLAADGIRLEPGAVYVAPDGAHLLIDGGDRLRLDSLTGALDEHRPSGSRLLSSAARCWGRKAIGVVLTGMGTDGCVGLLDIRQAGGTTIAQNRETSIVYGMPRVALEIGAAQQVLPASEIADALVTAARAIQRAAL